MGLGKVIGLGIVFVFLLIGTISATITGVLEIIATAIHNGYIYVGPSLILSSAGYLTGAGIFAFITYLMGKRFVRAVRQYKASQARKPLQ
jgi:hypothetical protein